MSDIVTIPLINLELSSLNVRKSDPGAVADLAASIATHQLQQNLVVLQSGDPTVDGVIAGGRRLRALRQLASEGKLPADWAVPCLVFTDPALAQELSTAENMVRLPMHALDQFRAFRALEEAGHKPGEIAERFGCEVNRVEQLLRLSRVAPELLEEYRKGKATLEQLQALAITDDQAAQRGFWKSTERQQWERHPQQIRASLSNKMIRVDSELGSFINHDEYIERGGAIREDLFEAGVSFYLDRGIVTALAQARLDAEAARIKKREGWAWAEGRIEFDYREADKYGRSNPHAYNASDWKAEHKVAAGIIVSVGRSGGFEVKRGLVRAQDKAAAAKAARGSGSKATTARAKPLKKPGELSGTQSREIRAVRTVILAEQVATNPRIALAALAASMANELLDRGGAGDETVSVSAHAAASGSFSMERALSQMQRSTEKQPAAVRLEALKKAFQERLPKRGSIFQWLLEQPESTTHQLLALCAGAAVDTYFDDGGREFAAIAGIDLAKHWTVDEAWLAQQPSAYIQNAVKEAVGKAGVAQLARCKGKKVLVQKALELLKGTNWLPEQLRARAPKPPKEPTPKAGKGKTTAMPAPTAPPDGWQDKKDKIRGGKARGGKPAAGKQQKCRECGCTELQACEGGCHWVEPDLCSTCAEATADA